MNMDIAEQVYGKLFYVPDRYLEKASCIMVNLNSLLSPLFYDTVEEEVITDRKLFVLAQSIIDVFKAQMIERYATKKVIFYYKDIYKPYLLRSLYPDWRIVKGKNEDSSVGRKIYDVIDEALLTLEGMGQVQVLKTDIDEHTFLPRIKRARDRYTDKIVIISRDPLDLSNAIYDNISVWNGRYYYNSDNIRGVKPMEFTNITPVGVPWVLLLAGAPTKIGYAGIYGFGIIKAIKYMTKNLHIISMTDEEILEDTNISQEIKDIIKYKPLFIFNEYLRYKDTYLSEKK